ncbi:15165_t:CDS:2, partial [Acaulospora morrowiae]
NRGHSTFSVNMALVTSLRQQILIRSNLSRSIQNFDQAFKFRCSRILPAITIRPYSSSSSSSSNSTKRTTAPATPQKKELPLLSFGNELMQQSVESTQQQDWEEEGDFEEESLASSNTSSLTNPLSPYLTSSPLHPAQSTISITSSESEVIANKFLDDIESKVREEETDTSTEDVRKGSAITNSQDQLTTNPEESERKNRKITDIIRKRKLYLTNIIQKRRLKMNKHKNKKLRKRQRALRKRLGK